MNHKKIILLATIVITLILLGFLGYQYYFYRRLSEPSRRQNQIQPLEKEKLLFYQNKEMGIEFWYPKHLKVVEEFGLKIVWPSLQDPNYGAIEPSMKLEITDADEILNYLTDRCAAGGPSGESYCLIPEISQIAIKTNENQLNYASFFTKLVNEPSGMTGEREITTIKERVGPFIFIPLSPGDFYILFYPNDPYYEYPPTLEDDFKPIITLFKYTPQKFSGIGIKFELRGDRIKQVKDVFENSPAARAGMKIGDVIKKVDGKDVTDLKLSEVLELIKGPVNTEVELEIQREQNQPSFILRVKREIITMSPVTAITEKIKKINAVMEMDGLLYEKVLQIICRGKTIPECQSFTSSSFSVLPDIDLHGYSLSGLHIGVDYKTNRYENQIEGAFACGEGLGKFHECISVPIESINTFYVSAHDTKEFLEKYRSFYDKLSDHLDSYKISFSYSTNWRSDIPITSFREVIEPGQEIAYQVYISDGIPRIKK